MAKKYQIHGKFTGGNVDLYIGPDKPTNGATYWLDTSEDEVAVVLTGISAVYSGGDVTVGTAVTDLTGIVVTATYSDGSTETVTDYTMSGTIAEGSNTVTVTYQNMTTTFTVTGVAESGGEEEPEPVTYTITNNLTNVTSNNSTASVEENASYTATLTAASGYELDTVTVTMGGTDVTSTVYANGVVTISAVTGNVVITAKATMVETESDVDLSEANTFTSIVGEVGNSGLTIGKSTTPSWDDLMALEVEKLYFYNEPTSKYQTKMNISAAFTSGWGSKKFADNVTPAQATDGTYDYVTNAWNKYSESGYVVFEIDVAALQAKIQAMYDDGTLDATKEKRVVFVNSLGVVAGSTVALLYSYNG